MARKAEIAQWKFFFFSLHYKSFPIQSGFEQLSSSIRWRVLSIYRSVFQPKLGFVGAEIFTNFCFFIHNFGYNYVRKLFKGFKDADFCLVSKKNLSKKHGSIAWGPGPGKSGQKNAKIPPLVMFPPENAKPKTKKFFSMSPRRLPESVEGLNSSLGLAARDLWPKKSEPIIGSGGP